MKKNIDKEADRILDEIDKEADAIEKKEDEKLQKYFLKHKPISIWFLLIIIGFSLIINIFTLLLSPRLIISLQTFEDIALGIT